MSKFVWLLISALALAVGSGGAASAATDTLMVNMAVYNAADVISANDLVTVPNLATYGVNAAALPIGSTLTVTLPAGFTFASAPTLSSAGGTTYPLTAGGVGSQTAVFTIATAPVATGVTIALNTFQANTTKALEGVVPMANALPLSVQSSTNDPAPLTAGAFASGPGIQSVFVGAIQTIDPNSNYRLYEGSPTATPLIVLTAIEFSAITTELTSAGAQNQISSSDLATEVLYGNFTNIASAFTSTSANCNPIQSVGTVYPDHVVLPGITPFNEVFTCITANGQGQLAANLNGFSVFLFPQNATDFLAVNPDVEYPGLVCYGGGTGGPANSCGPGPPPAVPTLSEYGEAALILSLGALGGWLCLRRRRAGAPAH